MAEATPHKEKPPPVAGEEESLWSIEVPRQAYRHSQDRGSPVFSLQFVAIRQLDRKRWHVRVVIECTLVSAPTTRERRETLEQLCRAIDFSRMELLDDTLTELFIHSERCGTTVRRFVHAPLQERLPFNPEGVAVFVDSREDPARFRFPAFDSTTTRLVQWDQLRVVERLPALAAYTVQLLLDGDEGGQQLYVLKSIERNLYIVEDTLALESELCVLEQVGGRDHIVRLVAAVVSDNPYSSSTPDSTGSSRRRVLRGLLLEYHPGGTLEAVLQAHAENGNANGHSNGAGDAVPWQLWATNLCTAVAFLHEHGFTHMDIKPSNMVIDKENNLVLIDVGGAGGFTREWLSPSMQALEQNSEPLEAPFEDRKQNDMWAVGKTLLHIAETTERSDERFRIEAEASKLMSDPPLASLRQAAARLQQEPAKRQRSRCQNLCSDQSTVYPTTAIN
ncbi:protein kinase domain-containing protein [Niveomyces insectorum RCEF 264]|uniref:Protein kinase domain-containing protein n=1 Tax=Niveomyces insectorum RCEF 264 TaxID=1081102 RepID=A0A162JBI9_9HYPO|nr:protein kinase domain-containing protein [Niveomyces insectorum RCEF 264]